LAGWAFHYRMSPFCIARIELMDSTILDNGSSHLFTPLRMSPQSFPPASTRSLRLSLPLSLSLTLTFILSLRLALSCSCSCSANVQLPTLWFAVLMAGHVLNHLIFDSQRLSPGARFIWFIIWTGSVVLNFWWFKDFALGIYGPVNDHRGWLWRGSWNVSQDWEPVRANFRK
jgi:hypothetical protein